MANVKFLRDAAADGGAVAKSPLTAFDKNDNMRGAELGILAHRRSAGDLLRRPRRSLKTGTAQAAA